MSNKEIFKWALELQDMIIESNTNLEVVKISLNETFILLGDIARYVGVLQKDLHNLCVIYCKISNVVRTSACVDLPINYYNFIIIAGDNLKVKNSPIVIIADCTHVTEYTDSLTPNYYNRVVARMGPDLPYQSEYVFLHIKQTFKNLIKYYF